MTQHSPWANDGPPVAAPARTASRPRDHRLPMDEPVVQEVEVDSSAQRGQGVKDLVSGAVLIGIGFALGGSVFTGDPTILDWFFDGLGTLWMLKGVYLLATA